MRTSGCDVLKLGDHAGDQRVHEKRRAADAHHAAPAPAENSRPVSRRLSRCRQHGLAVVGQRPAERRRLQRPAALDEERLAEALSSMERVRDTAGWVSPSRAAPSVTPPAWTTAASWTRCRSSIFIAIWYIKSRKKSSSATAILLYFARSVSAGRNDRRRSRWFSSARTIRPTSSRNACSKDESRALPRCLAAVRRPSARDHPRDAADRRPTGAGDRAS